MLLLLILLCRNLQTQEGDVKEVEVPLENIELLGEKDCDRGKEKTNIRKGTKRKAVFCYAGRPHQKPQDFERFFCAWAIVF